MADRRGSLGDLMAQKTSAEKVRDGRRPPLMAVLSAHLFAQGHPAGESEFGASVLPRPLLKWLEGAVPEQGGVLLKHEGGRILACWGGPARREEDNGRAIRFALSLRNRVRDFNQKAGERSGVHYRIGINVGPVQISGGETGPGATGEGVDVAEALAARAPEDGILLSEYAYRQVRGVFNVQPQEPMPAAPRKGPLGVYLLEREKPRAFLMPIRGVGNIETRTVGREQEIEALQDCYREAMGQSRTHFLLVTGDAGIGKSRLLYEFEKWLELLPEEILFFEGQATPEMARRPHGIFRDLLSFRFEIRDGDSAERVREKFRAGLEGLLDPDRADVLGHWLGFDFSGSESVKGLLGSRSFRQQAQADLCSVFRSWAADPVVLFLEDLHWADDSSLDLLDHLLAEVPDRKLLFVCLARPVLLEHRKNWAAEHPAFSRVDLKPLTEAQSHALVEEILQRMDVIPEDLRSLLVKGAQGNPFYLEELILLLVDKGVITADEERWHVDLGELRRVQLPDTLKGVLRARLDCLPSKERLLLQCASVVGRQFWGAAVAELTHPGGEGGGVSAADVGPLLDMARQRQLIFQAKSPSFEESQDYAFKHAVLREIVYESVLEKMKKAYHAGVARWLERNLQDRQTEYLTVLADHCEAAGEKEKAADYLVRAGEELSKVSAFRDAVAVFERALRVLPEERQEILSALLTDLGDACRVLGDHEAARRHLKQAVVLSKRTKSTRTEVSALNALARTAMIQGEYAEAKPYLAEALKLASRQGHQEGAAQVLLNLADVSFRLGDADTATTSGQQSLEIARELRDPQGIAGAHRVLGFASMMRGDNETAAHHHEEGLEIFRTIGDRWGVATCYINLGEVHRKMGRFEEAVGFWEKSLPLARDIGARLSVAISYVNMGGVLARMEGYEDRALSNLRMALSEGLSIGACPIVLEGLVSVAVLYAREGRQPLAARLLGTVTTHPAFNAEIQEYSDPLMRQLEKKLGSETVRTLLDQGRGLDLASVVDGITRKPGDGAIS
jgi:tetratricopeptide (TPR) repeat protein